MDFEVEDCTEPLKAQGRANAPYGLQRCGAQSGAARSPRGIGPQGQRLHGEEALSGTTLALEDAEVQGAATKASELLTNAAESGGLEED